VLITKDFICSRRLLNFLLILNFKNLNTRFTRICKHIFSQTKLNDKNVLRFLDSYQKGFRTNKLSSFMNKFSSNIYLFFILSALILCSKLLHKFSFINVKLNQELFPVNPNTHTYLHTNTDKHDGCNVTVVVATFENSKI
jgi:hypothetical protein